MTIPQKSIAGFVSDMVATWSVQTNTSMSFSDGDPLLAFWQAVAAQLDFLQAQIQLVLNLARAQTSTGPDLDSWMAQFNFTRLPGTYATTSELFSNPSVSSVPISIPVGAEVQTVGGGMVFQVVADDTQAAYSSLANAYILAVGQTSLTATIEAVAPGTAYNVVANTITQFGSSVPGIAACTNPSPVANGTDAESDASFRARFFLYLASLACATESAIQAAAESVEQGLLLALVENEQPNGTPLLGSFTVIADDGSGNPPASLINAIFNAVNNVRAFSVQPFVIAPVQISCVIALAINVSTSLPPGLTTAIINTNVQNAVAGMVNELGPGVRLNGSAIISTALSVTGVAAVNAASVTINGTAADLIVSIQQEARTTASNVLVSNY